MKNVQIVGGVHTLNPTDDNLSLREPIFLGVSRQDPISESLVWQAQVHWVIFSPDERSRPDIYMVRPDDPLHDRGSTFPLFCFLKDGVY